MIWFGKIKGETWFGLVRERGDMVWFGKRKGRHGLIWFGKIKGETFKKKFEKIFKKF